MLRSSARVTWCYRALAKHSQDRLFAGAAKWRWRHFVSFKQPDFVLTDQVGLFLFMVCVFLCIDWCELLCLGGRKHWFSRSLVRLLNRFTVGTFVGVG